MGLSLLAYAEDRYFDAGGVNLHYIDQGEGDPVVLVHGFRVSAQLNWVQTGIMPMLVESGYRVIALDLRGHGQSERLYGRDEYGIEMVHDVGRLLDHLGIEKAHIVGYSLGARIANKFRELSADRVISATLGGYGWGPLGFGNDGSPSYSQPSEEEALEALLSGGLDEDLALAMAAFGSNIEVLQVAQESLSSNSTPTLILVGDEDPRKPFAEAMLDFMPNLELRIIPGTHVSVIGQTLLKEQLLSFLREQSR